MTKFTIDDFLAAATDTSLRWPAPYKRAPIMITPLNLRLPVALPSPPYPGLNQDINTEPFPDYVDTPGFEAEPGHCTIDCSHTVCISISRHDSPPSCHCDEDNEEETLSSLARAQYLPRSTIEVNDDTIDLARAMHQATDRDHAITIHCRDAHSLLSQLEFFLLLETRHIDELSYQLSIWFSDEAAEESVAVCEFFFITMRMYVLRTLQPTEPRVLTLDQLCAEIHVYLWTMLREYVDAYTVMHPELEVEDIGPDSFFDVDPRIAPGMVALFWQGCAHDVVSFLVLQSRRAEEGFEEQEIEKEDIEQEDEENVEQEAETAS
jgi:hypothetical protein